MWFRGGLCGWEGPCSSGEGYVGGRDYVVQGRVMWVGGTMWFRGGLCGRDHVVQGVLCGWEGPWEGYVIFAVNKVDQWYPVVAVCMSVRNNKYVHLLS